MYENEIYSGAGAGSNTSGAQSGNQTGSNGAYSGGGYSANTENNQFGNAEYRTYSTQPTGGAYGGANGGISGGPEKRHDGKKGGGYFRKAMLAVSLGLFFGLFAGIGFYAVQQSTGMLDKDNGQAVISQNTQTDQAGAESQSGIKLTDTSTIRVVSSDVTDVVSEVMPAMVSIVNNYTQKATIFGQNYSQELAASGSGIIVAESDTELLIASNYHVVADATTLDVTFIDGTSAQAQIKGTDSDMDLAVIAIPLDSLSEDTKSAIAIATLGDSDSLKMGEPVIAIGNSLGYGQSVTNGIVSALDREIPLDDGTTGTFIQTNAAINPGNSGGALLNVKGEVIGINSNKIGNELVEGMGYAIPISAAKPIIADMMLKQTRNKVAENEAGYLGITLQTVTDQFAQMYNLPQGIYVLDVTEDSPAQQAGLLKGDIITSFDGERITSWEDMEETLQYYGAGTTVKLKIKRPENGEYKDMEISLTLGTKPSTVQ